METKTAKYDPTAAHQSYKLADGTPVPGVTTVLGVINKPALLGWAWEEGRAGRDYRKSRDKAADVGTLAHWMIECHLKGLTPVVDTFSAEDISKAENAVIKFMSWWDSQGLMLVASECQLVSEDMHCGGTLDIVARRRDGALALVDIKTSKGIYDEMIYQVAAYAAMWNEQPGSEPIAACIIARFGKQLDEGDFEVREFGDLSKHLTVFVCANALYAAIKSARGKRD
jgi:hypothetical protein